MSLKVPTALASCYVTGPGGQTAESIAAQGIAPLWVVYPNDHYQPVGNGRYCGSHEHLLYPADHTTIEVNVAALSDLAGRVKAAGQSQVFFDLEDPGVGQPPLADGSDLAKRNVQSLVWICRVLRGLGVDVAANVTGSDENRLAALAPYIAECAAVVHAAYPWPHEWSLWPQVTARTAAFLRQRLPHKPLWLLLCPRAACGPAPWPPLPSDAWALQVWASESLCDRRIIWDGFDGQSYLPWDGEPKWLESLKQ